MKKWTIRTMREISDNHWCAEQVFPCKDKYDAYKRFARLRKSNLMVVLCCG